MEENNKTKEELIHELKEARKVIFELELLERKHKEMEKAFSESEGKFRTIACTAMEAIILVNDKGEVSYWNPAAERIFGYKSQEVMGKDLHRLIIPQQYREAYEKDFGVFKMTGQAQHVGKTNEFTAIDKNGNTFPVEVSMSAMNVYGKWQAVGILRDITKRKKRMDKIKLDYQIQSVISSVARKSLEPISLQEQLEYTLRLLLSIPWFSLESKGCIYIVEDECEVLNMKAQQGFTEEMLKTCKKIPFGRCLCGKAALTREIVYAPNYKDHENHYPGMTPHGHYCVPILSDDKTLGVMNLYVNEGHQKDRKEKEFLSAIAYTLAGIIKRKQAEYDLQESEERYRYLVSRMSAVVFELTPDGEILFVNNAINKITGFKADEIIGKNWWNTFFLGKQFTQAEHISRRFQSGNINRYEIILTAKDDSLRTLELSSFNRYRVDGSLKNIVLFGVDITKRVKLMQALQAMSLIDELTSLNNRRGFFNLAQQQLKMAGRTKKELLLLYADLDNLKYINDNFGHYEGDLALIDTAGILKETFRQSDVLARIGGDEFAVLVIDAEESSEQVIDTRLKKCLNTYNSQKKRPYQLSVSVGMVRYKPGRNLSLDALLSEADKLMYKEKQKKNNKNMETNKVVSH